MKKVQQKVTQSSEPVIETTGNSGKEICRTYIHGIKNFDKCNQQRLIKRLIKRLILKKSEKKVKKSCFLGWNCCFWKNCFKYGKY